MPWRWSSLVSGLFYIDLNGVPLSQRIGSVEDEEALQSVLGSESLQGNTNLPP